MTPRERAIRELQIVHHAVDMIFRDYSDDVVGSTEEAEAADYIMDHLQERMEKLTRKIGG